MAEMSDNTNNKVTISADYFAELYHKANEPKTQMVECKGECQCLKAIAKERDELREQLEQERMNKCDEATAKRLSAAERCIEDIWNCHSPQEIADNEYAHIDIIRAYREKREEA